MKNVEDFLISQEAIIASIENFIEQFEEQYQSASNKIKTVLQRTYQLMFRKYYYCSFKHESNITPANILDKFVSKEYGDSLYVIPRVNMKNKTTGALTYSFSIITKTNHHIIDDITKFKDIAKDGIEVNEYGFVPLKVKEKIFNKKLFQDDEQYINYITDLCEELGITEIKKVNQTNNEIRTSSFAEKFMNMEAELKLKRIVSATYDLCSKNIQNNSELFNGIFTRSYIDNLFSDSFKIEHFFDKILQGKGINVRELDEESDEYEVAITFSGLAILDINLISIFGYYLGVAIPVTTTLYSIIEDLEVIEENLEDYESTRFRISGIYNDVHLNSYGGNLLGNKKRNGSKKVLPNKMGNKAFCKIIEDSREILEYEQNEFDEFKEYFNNSQIEILEDKPIVAKVINMPKKGAIYVLKVKEFFNKRNWKEVKIGFNDSMDDLNIKIQAVYGLSYEHLYAFFMSNKAWDSSSEYSHPLANGRNAQNTKIGSFELKKKDKFLYIFDFGKEKKFEIEVKDIEFSND